MNGLNGAGVYNPYAELMKYYCDVLEPAGIHYESKKTKTARLLTFRKGDGVTEGDGENDM